MDGFWRPAALHRLVTDEPKQLVDLDARHCAKR
jgi:hypothetical protein